jgi:hypothetical protein
MHERVAIGLLVCLLVAGCSTQGSYVKQEDVSAIQQSVTTAHQLHEALGTPSVTIPRDDGMVMWVYEGIHTRADATQYIPYLGMLIGTNSKFCTRLTVLVDQQTGALSDWNYRTATDTDYWAKTDDKCVEAKDN